ncbi:MAG: DsrE family protein [Deltaproteobacteria bacterium]|nr:DsrE family protein [Deltaproteobacteria bacterium]
MIDSICIIVKRPMGQEASILGTRTSYATLMSALETRLLFIDDGVFNLLETTGYNTAMLKEIIKQEGIIFCLSNSLNSRGLSGEDIIEGVKIVHEEDVPGIIEECQSLAFF